MTVNGVWQLPTLSPDSLQVEARGAPMRPAIGTAAIRAAFDGVTVCRLYMEMLLVCLHAAGRILRELGRG